MCEFVATNGFTVLVCVCRYKSSKSPSIVHRLAKTELPFAILRRINEPRRQMFTTARYCTSEKLRAAAFLSPINEMLAKIMHTWCTPFLHHLHQQPNFSPPEHRSGVERTTFSHRVHEVHCTHCVDNQCTHWLIIHLQYTL